MSSLLFPGTTFPGMEWKMTRKQLWSTTIQTMVNGQEARIGNWLNARYEFTFSISAMHTNVSGIPGDSRDLEYQRLLSFVNQMFGQYDTFLVDSWADNDNIVHAQPIANGDSATRTFQLVRTFGLATEPVYALNNTGNPALHWIQPVVYLNGVSQSGSLWSMNADTGALTFTSAPGSGVAITADFAYFWRCRMSEATQEYGGVFSGVWDLANPIKLITVRQ